MTDLVSDIFLKLLNMSISAGWITLIILGLRIILAKLPKRVIPVLWTAVAIKLVFPLNRIIHMTKTASENTENAVYDLSLPRAYLYYEDTFSGYIPVHENRVLIAACIWIAGMAILLLYAILKTRRLNLRLKTAVLYEDNVWICDHIEMPFVKGIFSPGIYMPSNLDHEDIPYILRHERIHLKRHDNLIKMAGFLLLIIYWFQPMCWGAYLACSRDLELACDEAVVCDMKLPERKRYAGILLKLSTCQSHEIFYPLAFGYIGLRKRVKAVLLKRKRSHSVTGIICAISVTAIIIVVTAPITFFAFAERKDAQQVLYGKVQDADLSENEINELYTDLLEQGYDAKDMEQLDGLKKNENGQLYGPDIWNPELIAVTSDQGTDGYCYRNDLYEYDHVNSPDEAIAWMKERQENDTAGISIPVYDYDGSTVIGTFTLNYFD
ncbi:MAG: M56 family metallopeptidase [Clostridiales bacterium]|nr:M56 family metallopeptidase [Clostridiales bacterium]